MNIFIFFRKYFNGKLFIWCETYYTKTVSVMFLLVKWNETNLLVIKSDYHWHFHAYPMILSVNATDYCLNFENNAHTHTYTHAHARTRTRAGDNLQYNISSEWNILNCAHDFLKCMLCLAYPTIILELKSMTFFGTHGHKEQFYFSKVCSD